MKDIHQRSIQDYLANAIGKPYEQHDCYDIIKDFYEKIFGIDLEDLKYADPSDRENVDRLFNIEKFKFKKVKEKRFGDIIVIRVYGLAAHVGIFLEGKKFIHTTRKTNCVIDSLDRYKERIVGIYRWPDLDIA